MNDNRKKNAVQKLNDFIAGKGFYIVLFVCAAVIGVSAWALFFADTDDVDYVDYVPAFAPREEDAFTVTTPPVPAPDNTPAWELFPRPTPTPAPTPEPTPPPTPAPTPEPEPEPRENEHVPPVGSIDDISFIRPIAGDVTKDYSLDELVRSRTLGDWRIHPGIDFAGALGTRVVAAADGAVVDVLDDDLLGTVVIIDYGFGMRGYYANLAAEPVVRAGEMVSQGAVIGAIGDTALSETGEVSHLHYEMKLNGEYVNPRDYLPI